MVSTAIDFRYDMGDHFGPGRFVAISPERAANRFPQPVPLRRHQATGRYMMNGHLIAHGYDGIVTPEARKLDYNRCLAALFVDADARPYIEFTLSCYDDPRGAR